MNAEIFLLREERMIKDQVVCQKQSASGNLTSRSNGNSFLDTCLYKVEFPGSKILELETHINTELMSTLCDVYGNEYLLLESKLDYGKNGLALSVENQNKVVKG